MGAIPYALSISHFVSSVGADAGFAAIIGLAILILLYFAQARETATLRDRFAEAAEQVRRLELQVAHLSRPPAANQAKPAGQAQAAVTPRPASAQAAAVPSRVARVLPVSEVPMAPAGVGAPALTAATRVVPSGDEGAISIRPGAARVAAAAGAAGAAGTALAPGDDAREAQAASGGGGVMAPPAPAPTGPASGGPAPTGPAPATAAAATAAGTGAATGGRANGGPNAPSGRTPAPAPASGTGAPPARAGQDPGRPYRIAGARPAGQPAQRQTLAPPPPPKRSGLRKALLTIAGLIVVAGIVAVLVVLTSSNSNTGRQAGSGTSADSNAPSANRHQRAKATALKPSQVTVAVLNGTATSNLAHDVSQKLTGAGYKPGMIATATDQTQAATTVGYMPGQRRAAVIVARSLNLGSTAIEPLTASNRAVACPQAACTAQVVVTVGSDLTSDASTSSAAPSPTAAGTTT
jgi:LytR cell envelope-related transcriptional attenuator